MSVSESQRQQLQGIIEQLGISLEASQSLGGNDSELADIESTLRLLNQKMMKLSDRKMGCINIPANQIEELPRIG